MLQTMTVWTARKEIECTSVYVADNDCLDSAYMQYFNIGVAAADTPELYVKVKE